MKYLSAEEIAAINAVVVEESGGSIGTREPGLLDSIASKPSSGFGDHESYPGIFLKATVVYEAIVNYPVFVDGNKRTGFAAMARFLSLNGYELAVTNKEIEEYTINIATWIKEHSKKVNK